MNLIFLYELEFLSITEWPPDINIDDWKEYVKSLNSNNILFDPTSIKGITCYLCGNTFLTRDMLLQENINLNYARTIDNNILSELTDIIISYIQPFDFPFKQVMFLEKPWIINYSSHNVCLACYQALTNPSFKVFEKHIYGYHGRFIKDMWQNYFAPSTYDDF